MSNTNTEIKGHSECHSPSNPCHPGCTGHPSHVAVKKFTGSVQRKGGNHLHIILDNAGNQIGRRLSVRTYRQAFIGARNGSPYVIGYSNTGKTTTHGTIVATVRFDDIPEAACKACGGWHDRGGCAQHAKSKKLVLGRTGCTCLPTGPVAEVVFH